MHTDIYTLTVTISSASLSGKLQVMVLTLTANTSSPNGSSGNCSLSVELKGSETQREGHVTRFFSGVTIPK